ncbi:MAG: T9SS type A sorting domain-containing protein [Lentimicrobiaceae bacterium]
MLNKKLIFSTLLMAGLSLTGVKAQQAIPATGGEVTGSGGSVSYTVGQMAYTTAFATNGSVSNGVQQPFEISVVTAVESAEGIDLMISTYPNPATDFITLRIDASASLDIQSMSYHLYDLNGTLMENMKIEGNETKIVMSDLMPATYFLRVTIDNKELKTFKIIKNK